MSEEEFGATLYSTFNVGNYTQWNYLPEEDARIRAHNTVNYYFSCIRPHLQMSKVGEETTFV